MLPASTVIDDPILMPVVDGTPVEIPTIVPAEVDADANGNGTAKHSGNGSAHTNGSPGVTALVPVIDPQPDTEETAISPDLATAAIFTDTDGTDGLPSLERPKKPARALRPVTLPRARRPRVRRVTRVVRTVDTWSVFKVSLVFSLFLYVVVLTAGVLLWQVAQNTGTVDNIERFFESFGWETFELKGGTIYHNAWVGGLFLVVALTGLCVLGATLFNLIADLVGGIRVTVLEEEVLAREERGTGWRRGKHHVEVPVPGTPEAANDPAVSG